MKYVLYNCNNNNISIKYILAYLDYLGYELEPDYIYESIFNVDVDVDVLQAPSICTYENNVYIGETECVKFYTEMTNITHLKDKAYEFNKYYSRYPKKLHKIKIE